MALPFEDKEAKNKRKYQCFVCARQYDNYEEFKIHIIEQHEQGRDYLLCPLKRCGAPVRDVASHFKVVHPQEKMPKVPLVKALIWKDLKGNKLKTKKPNFRKGWHGSTKMKKEFHFNSAWEKTVYELLDDDVEVFGYDAEPFEIEYLHKGSAHKYIPDIIVLFVDGHKELWEIKPANQTLLEQNQNKWRAAEICCTGRGWKFVVVTEQIMHKLKQKVHMQKNLGK